MQSFFVSFVIFEELDIMQASHEPYSKLVFYELFLSSVGECLGREPFLDRVPSLPRRILQAGRLGYPYMAIFRSCHVFALFTKSLHILVVWLLFFSSLSLLLLLRAYAGAVVTTRYAFPVICFFHMLLLRNLVKPKACLAFFTKFAFFMFSWALPLNFFIKFGLFLKSLLLYKYSFLGILCLLNRSVIFESFCFSAYVEVAELLAKLPQQYQLSDSFLLVT